MHQRRAPGNFVFLKKHQYPTWGSIFKVASWDRKFHEIAAIAANDGGHVTFVDALSLSLRRKGTERQYVMSQEIRRGRFQTGKVSGDGTFHYVRSKESEI